MTRSARFDARHRTFRTGRSEGDHGLDQPEHRVAARGARPTSRWWWTALALAAVVALLVVTTASAADPRLPPRHAAAHRVRRAGRRPRPGHRTDDDHDNDARTIPPAAVAPPPPEDTTLHTPEDVPDPSVRRPIQLIGRIQIPKIGLDTELRDQITQESIDLGPSHWPGTAAPGGFGNAVVAGHRNSHSAPFHDLARAASGRRHRARRRRAAARSPTRVTEMFVVNPDAMWITEQTPGSHPHALHLPPDRQRRAAPRRPGDARLSPTGTGPAAMEYRPRPRRPPDRRRRRRHATE